MSVFSLANRTALVTGASSGLGEHFAHVLAQAGASVVIAARRLDRLEAVAADIRSKGGKAVAVEMDVTWRRVWPRRSRRSRRSWGVRATS